jgi:hypothetical protein
MIFFYVCNANRCKLFDNSYLLLYQFFNKTDEHFNHIINRIFDKHSAWNVAQEIQKVFFYVVFAHSRIHSADYSVADIFIPLFIALAVAGQFIWAKNKNDKCH